MPQGFGVLGTRAILAPRQLGAAGSRRVVGFAKHSWIRRRGPFPCKGRGTELDRLPPESTELEDPGVVGLAAADLVDVYVAARESA